MAGLRAVLHFRKACFYPGISGREVHLSDERQPLRDERGQMIDDRNPASASASRSNPLERSGKHAKTAGRALLNWGRAVLIEGLCLAALWWTGLLLLHVPLAIVWALVAGVMAVVPNIGGVIALIGPVLSVLFTGHDMFRLALLLGLYAVIVVIDQLAVQPIVMKKVTRVPIWASVLAPIALGIIIPFWGVLLAPPLLAVVYAFRKPKPAGE